MTSDFREALAGGGGNRYFTGIADKGVKFNQNVELINFNATESIGNRDPF